MVRVRRAHPLVALASGKLALLHMERKCLRHTLNLSPYESRSEQKVTQSNKPRKQSFLLVLNADDGQDSQSSSAKAVITKKPQHFKEVLGFIVIRRLAMTYSHMGKPHTTIGATAFHF